MTKASAYVWCEACQTRVLAIYHRCKVSNPKESSENPGKLPISYKVATVSPVPDPPGGYKALKTKKTRNRAEYMRNYRQSKRGQ